MELTYKGKTYSHRQMQAAMRAIIADDFQIAFVAAGDVFVCYLDRIGGPRVKTGVNGRTMFSALVGAVSCLPNDQATMPPSGGPVQ